MNIAGDIAGWTVGTARAVLELTRSGVVRPVRPDRLIGMGEGLVRYGATVAAGCVAGAARHPDRTAIVDDAGWLSYAELHRRTDRLARALADIGIGPGVRVGVLCRNHRGPVETQIAVGKLGADAVLLNTGLPASQLAAVVGELGLHTVVADEEYVALVDGAAVLPPAGTKHVGGAVLRLPGTKHVGGAVLRLPGTKHVGGAVLRLPGTKHVGGAVLRLPGTKHVGAAVITAWARATPSLEELIARDGSAPLPLLPPAAHTIVLTSGTTGPPKGARRPAPHSLAPVAAVLSAIPLRAGEPVLIAAPLLHTWGNAALLLALLHGAPMILRRRFDPADLMEQPAVFAVPVMLRRLLETDLVPVHRPRIVAVSGSALPASLATAFMDRFGDVLDNLYGSTEVSWVSIAGSVDLRAAPGTAGRAPAGTRLLILDDGGSPVPPGEEGRVFLGNDMPFDGYTREGSDVERIGGLLGTGDVGRLDADGRLHLTGRADDMIVSGGRTCTPARSRSCSTPGPRCGRPPSPVCPTRSSASGWPRSWCSPTGWASTPTTSAAGCARS